MLTQSRPLWLPLVAIIAIASCSVAYCQDKVVGAIWEITYDTTTPEVRKYRGTPDFKIWNMPVKGAPRVIGKWSWIEKDVSLTLEITGTQGPNAKARGKYELVQIGKDPPSWQGEFVTNEGKKVPVKVRLLAD